MFAGTRSKCGCSSRALRLCCRHSHHGCPACQLSLLTTGSLHTVTGGRVSLFAPSRVLCTDQQHDILPTCSDKGAVWRGGPAAAQHHDQGGLRLTAGTVTHPLQINQAQVRLPSPCHPAPGCPTLTHCSSLSLVTWPLSIPQWRTLVVTSCRAGQRTGAVGSTPASGVARCA